MTRSALRWVLLLVLLAGVTGCASNTAYVIARRDIRFNLTATNKLTLATHPHPSQSTRALHQTLVAVLEENGLELVPPAAAEFTLTYWLDDSWKPGKKVIYRQGGRQLDSYPMSPATFYADPSGGIFDYSAEPVIPKVVDVPYHVQGIRLKVYPKSGTATGQFETAWEGYIEGGDRVSAKRGPVLLRTLLQYFGQDFIGRANLIREPDGSR